MKTKTLLICLLSAILLSTCSCVSPGNFDQKILNRYQESMAEVRAPQKRLATTGLGSLQPAPGTTGPKLKVSTDAAGNSVIYLSLDEAIMRTLANSLDIQVVSFSPEITRQQAIQAAAVFDYILFGGVSYNRTDQLVGTTIGATQLSPGTPTFVTGKTRTTQYQAGIRETTVCGGTWQIAPTLTRVEDRSQAFHDVFQPALLLQLDQPLLRNAGPDFTLANLRIARLNYETSVSQFRQKVEETVNTVINTYWALMQARIELKIQEELLAKTIETRDRIRNRLSIDATLVEVKQAEAAVETRRAVLFRTQKNILDVQNSLARFMADAQINVLNKYEIVPTSDPAKVPVKIDTADQLVLSLIYSPILEQARLAISVADVNVKLACNQTLPKLDLQATMDISGAGNEFNNSFDDFTHVGYSLALLFEYPIGNRGALANLAQQKFTRLQAISTLQNTADQVAVAVSERIRQVNTSFLEMQAQKAAVEASAAQLQALQNTEQIRGRLSPEFLQVKLQAQQTLADSQGAELQAIVNYNQALSDLARLTGTMLKQYGIEIQKMQAVTGEGPWPQYRTPTSAPELVPLNPAGSQPTTLVAPTPKLK